MRHLKYKLVLLKVSGELLGSRGQGIDNKKIVELANIIKTAISMGVQIAIVMGGGNWWRKRDGDKAIRSETSDYMGMIGTVLNGLALSSYLTKVGVKNILQAHLVSAPGVDKVNIKAALAALKSGRVVVFAGGTGKPFVTTDTSAALLAQKIKADVILKVGEVDGVYSADPDKNKKAKKYKELSFAEAINKRLKIFDLGAYRICQQAGVPLVVFKWGRSNLFNVLRGKQVGTIIS